VRERATHKTPVNLQRDKNASGASKGLQAVLAIKIFVRAMPKKTRRLTTPIAGKTATSCVWTVKTIPQEYLPFRLGKNKGENID